MVIELRPFQKINKIAKETYISPEERQEIIDELKLKYYNDGISENSQQNNSEKVTNKNDTELLKEKYAFPIERQKIINNLRPIKIV